MNRAGNRNIRGEFESNEKPNAGQFIRDKKSTASRPWMHAARLPDEQWDEAKSIRLLRQVRFLGE